MTHTPLRRHLPFVTLLILLAAAAPVRGASFNDIVPGAKAMGMGMAFTAIADDPYAMYYNPGGLAGTDFTTISGTVGRAFSPLGPLGYVTMAYIRPFPLREESAVGVGYLTLREQNGGDKDQFTFHYSEPIKLPQLYLTRPLKVGGNFKIISIDGGKLGKKTSLGLDAGAVAETNFGLRGGLAVLDLTPELGVANPTIALGLAYTRNRVTLAGDLRARPGLAEFYPGIEVSFFQGLLKGRAGKGMPARGISQVSYGFGVNFSPVIVDVGMTMPWNGITRDAGSYALSVTYRFDAPPFYGRFVGSAARQAEDLKSQLLELEDRKRTLEVQVQAAETSKQSVEGQLRSMEGRTRSLQEQMRSLEIKVDERKYEVEAPRKPATPPIPATAPKADVPVKASPSPYPRRHVVAPGDTLRSIAAHHYGDPSLWETIYNANSAKIDRGLPREGEMFVIPAPPSRNP